MKRSVILYVQDILESIDLLEKYTENISEKDLETDISKQDAIIRRIEIIGEASSQMPNEFKEQHSEIPWRDIINMRNILIHHYFGVYLDRLLKVAHKDLPVLKEQLKKLLDSLEE